ncbi:MAG TPA: VOC family protein [Streptosporangiaceae bacterium]|nr:VOC family protein [Streptosporangiaceae bacterium]
MNRVQWTTVVLDCGDPAELATFWSKLLGGEHSRIKDDFHVVRSGTMWLATQHIPDPRPATWPDGARAKQIHLDVAVTDLDAAVAEALRLGATQEDVQPSPRRWRVMRDPAGHLFCLSDHIHEYLPIALESRDAPT